MALIGKFTKQPADVLDYDVDYVDWLEGRPGVPALAHVSADPGINVLAYEIIGTVVKTVLAGGIDGTTYKITVQLTTTDGLLKEVDFAVSVKES